jgi:hypothetical protein
MNLCVIYDDVSSIDPYLYEDRVWGLVVELGNFSHSWNIVQRVSILTLFIVSISYCILEYSPNIIFYLTNIHRSHQYVLFFSKNIKQLKYYIILVNIATKNYQVLTL